MTLSFDLAFTTLVSNNEGGYSSNPKDPGGETMYGITLRVARANGYRWVIDDFAGMLYRQHEENEVGVNLGWRASIHRARKVLSGWGLNQSALIARLVGLDQDPFVMRWSCGSRVSLLELALHAGQCRRRLRDKMVFALSCVALCVAGKRR